MPVQRRLFRQLRHRIEDAGYQDQEFAAKMGWPGSVLSARLNGRTPWSMADAFRACGLLQIPLEEMSNYFADAVEAEARKERARC